MHSVESDHLHTKYRRAISDGILCILHWMLKPIASRVGLTFQYQLVSAHSLLYPMILVPKAGKARLDLVCTLVGKILVERLRHQLGHWLVQLVA